MRNFIRNSAAGLALLLASACATKEAPVESKPYLPGFVAISTPAPIAPAIVETKKEEPKVSPRPDVYDSNGYKVTGAIGGHSVRTLTEETFKVPIIALGKDSSGKPIPYVVGYNINKQDNEFPFTFTRRDTFVEDISRKGRTINLEHTVYGTFAQEWTIDTPKSDKYPDGKKPATELWTSRYVDHGAVELGADGTGDAVRKVEGLREFDIKYGESADAREQIYIFTMPNKTFAGKVVPTRQVYSPVKSSTGEDKLRIGYRNDEGFYTLSNISADAYKARNAPKAKPAPEVPVAIEVTEIK